MTEAVEQLEIEDPTETLEPEAPAQETPEAETDEVVVSIGDEPAQEESEEAAPGWVKELRAQNRELKRKLKEVETATTQTKRVELGPKPTLEASDYDAERFERDLEAWHEKKRDFDAQEAKAKAEKEAAEKDWQDRLNSYSEAKTKLRVRDYDEAEDFVKDAFNVTQQGVILQGAEDPALLVYALGKNPAKAKELAAIKDPVKFAFAVAKLETKVKTTPRTPSAAPDKTPVGNAAPSGSVDKTLERLRADANRTGDWSQYFEHKRKLSKK